MARRLQQTFGDYLAIAISPALIIVLLSSFLAFLINVFYQGEYVTRLSVIFFLFSLAATLISRISIEEGRERAALFGLALAAVTGLAILRFIEFTGPFAKLMMVACWGFIAFVWWCADKLVWDCTVIDDGKDASGEGLLQTAGLDTTADDSKSTASPLPAKSNEPEMPGPAGMSWWQRYKSSRHRPHAPGVWVIYFSLFALPLFGLGQWFIPSSDLDRRRWVFKLFCTFVAMALALLMTSSFLGLRRYLRQRRIQMPAEIALGWVGMGAVMILGLLLACSLLPRPSPEYSLTHVFAKSPDDLSTSRWALGNDGKEEDSGTKGEGKKEGKSQGQQQQGQQQQGQQQQGQQQQGQQQQGQQQQGQQQQGQQQQGQQQQGQQQQGQQQQGQQQQGQQQQGQQQQGQQQQGQQQKQGQQQQGQQQQGQQQQQTRRQQDGQSSKKESSDGGQSQDQEKSRGRSDDRTQKESLSKKGSKSEKSSQSKSDDPSGKKSDGSKSDQDSPSSESNSKSDKGSSGSTSGSRFNPGQLLNQLGSSATNLLKWLYYAFFVLVALYFVWKYWSQVWDAFRNFMRSIRDFWLSLFGKRAEQEEEVAPSVPTGPAPVPFASFYDPFGTGAAHRMTPNELVRYTFSALEAWSRDHQCPRGPEETPSEFALRVMARFPSLGRPVLMLSELYGRAAYSGANLQIGQCKDVRTVWQSMLAEGGTGKPM